MLHSAWRSLKLLGLLIGALTIGWGPALAGDLSVIVRGPDGAAVANAVVTVRGLTPPTTRPPGSLRIEQRNSQFSPFVSVAAPGVRVDFLNLDKVQHHVYSFSPAGPFELKLFGAGTTRSVNLSKPGSIAVGCNIHDQMVAFIRVTDAPYAAVSDAGGRIRFAGLPAGDAQIEIWHPYQRGGGEPVSVARLKITGDGVIEHAVQFAVRRPHAHHGAY